MDVVVEKVCLAVVEAVEILAVVVKVVPAADRVAVVVRELEGRGNRWQTRSQLNNIWML